jgi:alanine dehydrogenase
MSCSKLTLVTVPFFSGADVERAVSPHEAYEAVTAAFIAHAQGTWTMQPKVYVSGSEHGDFRAMPALGDGHAVLKWVTSFPGNPPKGLPTVTGLVLLSDTETGELLALMDAAAVTALRTAAAAVIAAETLCRSGAESTAVIGCGVNGAETARMFRALGGEVQLWDTDPARAGFVADRLGATVAPSQQEALECDIVVTVTPGREVLFPSGSLRDGQHVSMMGADGPGKAEVAVGELARADLFCDDWEQASHGGELAAGVVAGVVTRDRVTDIGRVLAGDAEGRRNSRDITLFDSTGLAIQDLAIAKVAVAKADQLDLTRLEL